MKPIIKKNCPEALNVHEWLAIAIMTGLLGGLALITFLSGPAFRQSRQFQLQQGRIEVLIKGAVDHPGVYRIPPGMPMKDLLALAAVRENGDLRRYRPDSLIKKTRLIHVPEQAMMTVYVTGEVLSSKELRVPKGVKVEDLLPLITLTDEADPSILRKKRKLKPNEVIEIPKKQSLKAKTLN